MIVGSVNDRRQGIVRLDIIGASDQINVVAFLLDTGFNGGLTLPPPVIRSLGLTQQGMIPSQLADGSKTQSPWYCANVIWDGLVRPVSIVVANGEPLLGMSLIVGHQITIDMVDGGAVRLERRA